MLLLSLQLRISIARKTRDNPTHRARNAVRNAGAEVGKLTLCFLCFAVGVLFLTLLLETLFDFTFALAQTTPLYIKRKGGRGIIPLNLQLLQRPPWRIQSSGSSYPPTGSGHPLWRLRSPKQSSYQSWVSRAKLHSQALPWSPWLLQLSAFRFSWLKT